MREAVGGTLLFYIIITFLFVYVIFIGVIMNYASTYRTNNYIVSIIEENEADINVTGYDFLQNIQNNYHYNGQIDYCCLDNSNGSVYRVKTYVAFELPLISLNLKLPITMETKTIYGISCSDRETYFTKCSND